jgi:broad specificity phosphatase PhoE
MSEILLIRHGETDMAGTFCGYSDPELNARGWAQVRELVGLLRMEDICAVYTSDLRRAHAAATALAEEFRVDCHVRPALREIGFGNWEGLAWKEIEELDAIYARRWIAEYPNLPAPGGELLSAFERRVMGELELLSSQWKISSRSIVVVSHAGVLQSVLRRLRGYSEEEVWKLTKAYCSMVRISRDLFANKERFALSHDLMKQSRVQGEGI